MSRPRRHVPNPHRAGFTLSELMAVVVIVLVGMTLAAPAISTALAEKRSGQVTLDLVRLGRRARADAIAYGRAHLLRYGATGADGDFGRVRLIRGFTGGCNTNDWAAILTAATDCVAAASPCIDELDASATRYRLGGNDTLLSPPADFTTLDICYEPNGRMMYSADGSITRFTANNTAAIGGGFVFRAVRQRNSVNVGPARRVLFPLGGTARVLR
jgi:prepilin-type N-terminal cleavage/methylation domain-containing protein